jgi:hypothetical protein
MEKRQTPPLKTAELNIKLPSFAIFPESHIGMAWAKCPIHDTPQVEAKYGSSLREQVELWNKRAL